MHLAGIKPSALVSVTHMTGTVSMPNDASMLRLKIQELHGRIQARQRLAEEKPEGAWHLRYIEIYRSEVQQLQARLDQPSHFIADAAKPAAHDEA